jgi:hypothetical protein
MLQALIGPVAGLLDKFIEDKDQKNRLAHEIATMSEKHIAEAMALNAQANVESAKSSSLFVAGARPAIMWVCCLGLLTEYFIMPMARWGTALWAPDVILPELSTEGLMTLTLSLLGLGGLRSFEKYKGVSRESMK